MEKDKKGKVYLVGAGPGDPGLITLKGKECISTADVIVYDNLANRELLKFARSEVELVYAGKKGGEHTLSQKEINALIVQKAREGKVVVRLKGGDPFIFGRGGEEAQALVMDGLDFEVVPGITSAIAVPAYAGIPLTHRSYTSTVAFITGHEDPTKEKSDIAWDKLATGVGTLVFLMGVSNLPKIARSLMDHGRSPDTPVAIIRKGTVAEQRTVVGKLGEISEIAQTRGIRPPAIIVVGEVVELRQWLNWFEKRPLFGRRIIVTRAREQASEFVGKLADLGAECIEFPTIEVVPPDDWGPLDKAIDNLSSYDWIIFTSVNGVRFFWERLRASGKDARVLSGVKIGTIGPKTASSWSCLGIIPDMMPAEYRAEAVVEFFKNQQVKGKKILLPRAAEAREILPQRLREMGAQVDVVVAYRTIMPDTNVDLIRELLKTGQIDMVTFTSSSTVRNFSEMFRGQEKDLREWLSRVAVGCIGPITAKTAWGRGFAVHVVPDEYTIEGLTRKIADYFSSS